ncbi:hypothetical protein J0910_14260 [Nocardiopsis sp. CNT-189]|uniref:DUF6624 domain-containing protein n=1 Tax=Nocardiopsis oceanisediminis TaxID=2816862 RepID=UPI003B360970
MQEPETAAELHRRAERDQEARRALPPGRTAQEWERIAAPVDRENRAWVRGVIDRLGWPGRSLVGTGGAEAAWLLVQHCELETQERCLPLLEAAVAAGEAEPWHLAYLEDRVRCRRGLPQRYGTQYISEGGGPPRLQPVEDPDRLDERRAAAGLGPHAEHEAAVRAGGPR